MKKNNLKPLILSSLAALALAGFGTGATFALFTDKAETTINVQAGKVDVESTPSNLKLYSAKADPNGDFADENGEKYSYEEKTNAFTNGGTASFTGNTLAIQRLTPGDKIVFDLALVNNSNVKTKYRLKYTSTEESKDLLIGMEGKIRKQSVPSGEFNAIVADLNSCFSYQGAWNELEAGADIADLQVELSLPMDSSNSFQELSGKITFYVEAVQGNASVSGEEEYDRMQVVDGFIYHEEGAELTLAGSTKNYDGKALAIPDGTTIIVPSAFAGEKIVSLVVPASVKEISQEAFRSDSSGYATGTLTSVTLNEGLKKLGYRTFKAQAFTSIDLPSTLIDLGEGAFWQCSNLRSAVVPAGVTELNQTFAYCTSLAEVSLPEGLKTIGTDALRETALKVLEIPSTVTSIGSQALRQCNKLETVRILGAGLTSDAIADNTFTNVSSSITFYVKDKTVYESLTGIADPEPNQEFVNASAWKGLLAGKAKFIYKDGLGKEVVAQDNAALASAVANAIPGDTVKLAAGTYTLPETLANDVMISGTSPAETTVDIGSVAQSSTRQINIENATITNPALAGSVVTGAIGGGTLKNVVIDSRLDNRNNGLRNTYVYDTLTIEDSKVYGDVYGIHADGGTGKIVVKNTEISGWNSFSKTLESVEFIHCTFHKSSYGCVRFYQNGRLDGCTFDDAFDWVDVNNSDVTVEITNCTNLPKEKLYLNGSELENVHFIVDGVEVDVGSH